MISRTTLSASLLTLMFALTAQCLAQTGTSTVSTDAVTETRIEQKVIQLEGLVIAQGKYSIKVKSGEKEYIVKLANGAPIAMKMNKPWFDWNNEQVVVDEIPYPATDQIQPNKRVSYKLPAKELYVVSRFSDRNRFDEFVEASVKRINFYLVTPENQGDHLPTEKEPYVAGKLDYSQPSNVRLLVDESKLPVKLGFRLATMNGYSIGDLVANKVQVFLTGIEGDRENVVIASRVLFQPVKSDE